MSRACSGLGGPVSTLLRSLNSRPSGSYSSKLKPDVGPFVADAPACCDDVGKLRG